MDFDCSRSKTQHNRPNAFMQNHTFVRLGKVEKRVLMFGMIALKNLVEVRALLSSGFELKTI